MNDSFDDFVSQLQQEIYDDARAAYGDVAYERWMNPLYMGEMADADVRGSIKGSCGDTIDIFLKFDAEERVQKASFITDGCAPSVICASFAAELCVGRNPDELAEISGDMILGMLNGLPQDDVHCAYLAASAVHEALDRFMRRACGN